MTFDTPKRKVEGDPGTFPHVTDVSNVICRRHVLDQKLWLLAQQTCGVYSRAASISLAVQCGASAATSHTQCYVNFVPGLALSAIQSLHEHAYRTCTHDDSVRVVLGIADHHQLEHCIKTTFLN